MKLLFFGCLMLLFTLSGFCQTLPADIAAEVDWVKLVTELAANPKGITASFIGALVVLVAVQLLKSKSFGGFFKKIEPKVQILVITVLGFTYSFIVHVLVVKDQNVSVAIGTILSSGGAVAIFNLVKLFFEKPEAVKAPEQSPAQVQA